MTTREPRTEPEQTGYRVRSDQKPLSTETAYQDEVCACCGASPCVTVPMELTYGWRPISEAPREVDHYLAFFPASDDLGYMAQVTRVWWDGSGWDDGYMTDDGHEPTHWMPLPPPPREDTDA